MNININSLIDDSRDMVLLSEAEQVGAVKVLLRAVSLMRDKVRDDLEKKPRKCPEDFTKDYRYKAGAVACLNKVLRLPGEAKDQLKTLPEGD